MLGASALTTLGALPPFLLGAQAVAVRADLGLGLGVFGAAVGVFFGAAALATILGSGLLDRLGRRWGLVLAGSLVATGGGTMTLLARDPGTLLAAMGLMGLGNAACQATANLTMARVLTPGRRGLGFGIKQSAVPVAIMLAGLSVPTVGQVWGWRTTFAVTAVLGLTTGVLALVRGNGQGTPPTVTTRDTTPPSDRPPTAPLLVAGLAITFASAAANFLGAFAASWGAEVGMSPARTGLLMAAGSGGSVVMRVLSGWRADRRHGANLPVVATQMFVGSAAMVGLMLPQTWSVTVFGLLAFSVGWAWPGLLLYAVARLGRDHPTHASGFVQAGAFTGGAVGPVLLGALSGQVGFPLTWLVGAGCFLVAGSLVLTSRALFARDLIRRPPREPLRYGRTRVTGAGPEG
jgi:predicted MFS family arabinose efflux permease